MTAGQIIEVDKFVQAIRDAGYKSTADAIAELVDNAVQAGAHQVSISLDEVADEGVRALVMDDGCGMSARTLRAALSFGGSTRFNDRGGLGRYGMGLPSSSLSQARRVDVYTWKGDKRPIFAYLDLDEVTSGHQQEIPQPRPTHLPKGIVPLNPAHGTLVCWRRCDRLDNRRLSTLQRKLCVSMGRIFRYQLLGGLQLLVNGELVMPIDPLFLREGSKQTGGRMFGEPLTYEVEGAGGAVGTITVTFSELPIERWHDFSREEKVILGVTKGATVSVIRAGREVDRGWLLMGDKRRENYDDWWRCEVCFDPILDELFGLTHTKQQVRPTEQIKRILCPDLEAIARALNARARKAHAAAKARALVRHSEQVATARERYLEPLPDDPLDPLQRTGQRQADTQPRLRYHIVEGDLSNDHLYAYRREGAALVLTINANHSFYKHVYKPLLESERAEDALLRGYLELTLLAAARSEAALSQALGGSALERYRTLWGQVSAHFIKG